MFKSASDFERGVVDVLNLVMEGKVEYDNVITEISIDKFEFIDIWKYIEECKFVAGVSVPDPFYNPLRLYVGEEPVRVTYYGLKFLSVHDKRLSERKEMPLSRTCGTAVCGDNPI